MTRALLLSFALTLVAGCDALGSKPSSKADETEASDEAPKKKKKKDKDDGEKSEKKKPAATATAAATSTATTAPEVPPLSGDVDRPVTAPEDQSYGFDGITKVADNCASAFAIVANAPDSVGADYPWPNTKQALVANGQYKVVSGEPTGLGEVTFQVHHADKTMNNAWVLVARCNTGSTCNNLAAMVKSVVKTSQPQPGCGALPAGLGRVVKKLDLMPGGPRANVPKKGDVQGSCARISACTVAMTPTTKEDVLISCQKQPAAFKTDCAMQWPCAAVMSCTGK